MGVIAAATGAMLLTGVLALGSIIDRPPLPSPVSFSVQPTTP
jgi:hypothetical protein